MLAVITTLSCFLACIISILGGGNSSMNSFYISPTGNDTNNCSKQAPCQTIQFVVNLASRNDEIILCDGTFNQTEPIFINNTDLTIRADSSGNSTIDCQRTTSGLVLSNSSITFQGLNINNCVLNEPTNCFNSIMQQGIVCGGAAILAVNQSTLSVQNCSFTNNSLYDEQNMLFGGAIFVNQSAQLTILQSSFVGNSVSSSVIAWGGAIAAESVDNITVESSQFYQNMAYGIEPNVEGYTSFAAAYGGALSVQEVNALTLTANTFGSFAEGGNGAYGVTAILPGEGDGGAVLVIDINSLTITDCNFTLNVASGGNTYEGNVGAPASGGAVAIEFSPPFSAEISGGRWQNNTAISGTGSVSGGTATGGAISISPMPPGYLDGSYLLISSNASFTGNQVTGASSQQICGEAQGSAISATIEIFEMFSVLFAHNIGLGQSSGYGGNLFGTVALFGSVRVTIAQCGCWNNQLFGSNGTFAGGETFGSSLLIWSGSGDENNHNSSVTIDSCEFISNSITGGFGSSTSGGDVTLSSNNNLLYHTINITHSHFVGAAVTTGVGTPGGIVAGGSLLAFAFTAAEVVLSVVECTFSATQITGGYGAAGSEEESGAGGLAQGGAVFLDSSVATASFTGCIFANNTAFGGNGGNYTDLSLLTSYSGGGGSAQGGAIYSLSLLLVLRECQFSGNSAYGGAGGNSLKSHPIVAFPGGVSAGGAIVAQTLEAYSTSFCANIASSMNDKSQTPVPAFGGAISANESLYLHNVTLSNNHVYSPGFALAGALLLASNNTVANCSFKENTASGSIRASGGGACWPSSAGVPGEIEVRDTFFIANYAENEQTQNYAAFGGGLFINTSSPGVRVWNCTFTENHAQFGGGLYLSGISDPSALFDLIFQENVATFGGGAAFFDANQNDSWVCNLTSTNDNNTQLYGPVSSNPRDLEWHVFPEDCAIWNSTNFQASLYLLDLCTNRITLPSVYLFANLNPYGPFSSDVPLGLVPVSNEADAYSFTKDEIPFSSCVTNERSPLCTDALT